MSIKCKLGMHTWGGCKCTQCGKIRDEQHDWLIDCEKCTRCGKTRVNQHDWKDCESCSRCFQTRNNQHLWNGCKCTKCGKIGSNLHVFVDGYCSFCGMEQEGVFFDKRDRKKYKTIKIRNQIIMNENLAFKPSSGKYWAYNNDEANLTKWDYGYLYDWETANAVVPVGWHLPTKEEWESIYNSFRGSNYVEKFFALRNSGFNCLSSGYRRDDGNFLNDEAYFWSNSVYSVSAAYYFYLDGEDCRAGLYYASQKCGLSIRLFKD